MKENIPATLPKLLEMKTTKQKFYEVLGSNAASFIASLLSMYNEDEKLRKCDPVSILAAAKQAAILQLPIMKQLGYAYVIPYYDGKNKKQVAQFQMGYKGFLQLAMRSGVFRNVNTVEIYEGEIKSRNKITGEIELGERTSDEVVGYVAYMELVNGFSKTLYMTRAEIEEHAQKYSQSYAYDLKSGSRTSIWSKNFDTMAKKTVLKKLMTTYAPTSIEMQNSALATALKADQAVISKDSYQYVDNGGNVVERTDDIISENSAEIIDAETGEIVAQEDISDDGNRKS